MTAVAHEPEILEAEVPAGLVTLDRGEVDVQITTAKRYPRSVATFKKTALEMATLDEETAEACFYALPRGGRTIEGPSARLAEICLSAWGNMRAEARQVAEDERFVTSRGTAWDLQTNVAIAFEVKRRITTSSKGNKESKRYDDDMIGVTSNAASSIALRNAVFKAIPAAFWKPIYHACRKAAIGDVKTIATRRALMIEHFQKMGVQPAQVLGLLDVKGVEDINTDHLLTLKGLATALKDGETSIDEVFAAVQAPVQMPQRRTEAAPAQPQPVAEPATSAPSVTTDVVTGDLLIKVDRKEHSKQKGFFYTVIYTKGGKAYYTENDAIALACEGHMNAKRRVEITAENQTGKPAPVVIDVAVVGGAE